MIGAITGDMAGSIYEFNNHRSKDFEFLSKDCYFTDDTVLTVAVADIILNNLDPAKTIKEYAYRYPDPQIGFGGRFRDWVFSTPEILPPYNSWGNGAAMRVSPVGWAFDTTGDVIDNAVKVTEVTHNHDEGIKGAVVTALAIFLARKGASKVEINDMAIARGYTMNRSVKEIAKTHGFDESCQGTVPVAIQCFLESNGYEDAVRNAISLGGDSDTLACITGSIAEAYYKWVGIRNFYVTLSKLDKPLSEVVISFYQKYMESYCK